MQNPLLKFRQSSIISEKPGYLSGKLKIFTGSDYHRVSYFLLTFCTTFLLTSVCNTVLRAFYFVYIFRSSIYKPDFSENVETRFFFILANNSRSKQNETNLEHAFEHIGKEET